MSFRRAGMNSPSVHDLIERFNNKEPLVSVFDDINALQPDDEGNKSRNAPPAKPRKPTVGIDDKISNDHSTLTTVNSDNKEVSASENNTVIRELPPVKPRKSLSSIDDKISNDDSTLTTVNSDNKEVSASENNTESCELPPAKPRKSLSGINDKISNDDSTLTTVNSDNKEVSASENNTESCESPPEKPLSLDQVTVFAIEAENDQISPSIVVTDEKNHTYNSDNKDKCTEESTEVTSEKKLKNQTQRGYIMDEVIQTEKNYLSNLKIVLGIISHHYSAVATPYISVLTLFLTSTDVFLIPIRTQEILCMEEILTQFKNWENLVKVHEIFYNDLVKESEPNLATMSKLFIDISKFFKIYEAYLVNYEVAQRNRAKLLIKNKKYAELIDKAMTHPLNPRGYSLETLLIEPVQRLPRYRLLLQQLKKYSCNDRDIKWEHDNVCRALETMEKIASDANEAIRKAENKAKIMEIMNRMSFQTRVDLVDVDGRMFIKEGILHRQCRRVVKPFKFWLFSDLFIYGEQIILSTAVADAIGTLPTFNINRTINLNACKIIAANDSYTNHENAFIVQSPQKSFVVWAASPAERQEWMDGIQSAQTALQSVDISTVAIAPIWTPDRNAPECSVCKVAFTVFVRRHHCRSCGSIVCDSCSKKRYLLAHVDKINLVRVCDTCYDKYVTIAGGSSKKNSESLPSPSDSAIHRISENVSAVGGAVRRKSLAAMSAVNDTLISPVLRQFSNKDSDNTNESSESNSSTPQADGASSAMAPRRSISQMIGHLLGTDEDDGPQQQAVSALDLNKDG